MTARPPWITRACLLAVSVLVVAELIARWGFASSVEGRFDYGYHPTAGFVEGAHGQVDLVRSGGRRFFPQSFTTDRPTGTFRIFVLGDSVPRGVSVGQAYGGQLSALLKARGDRAEVWNLCVPGYGVRRIQTVLKQALHYHPSLVILHLNNSNEFEDEREYRRSQEFATWHPKNWAMKSFLFRRLYEAKMEQISWKLLPDSIRAQQGVNDADTETTASMNTATVDRWDERVRVETARSVALCRDGGVPVVLVTQARATAAPAPRQIHDAGLASLARSLTNSQVAQVSMWETLHDKPASDVFADTSHLKPSGHALMAEAILKVMAESRLLETHSARREEVVPPARSLLRP